MSDNYLKTMVYGPGFSDDLENEKMDAQVPVDARTSMRAVAAEEPTKNKVFDINLVFEQLVSRYNTFKGEIESKVYEMLNFQVDIAGIDYTDRRLANTVWSLLESYSFGSIERNFQKINWFDTEERKELMANIVLNNEGYAERLGYGNETGSMDYLFAARLAVLTFVDWVDREYVENSWISSLAASFGVNIRLADLVNQVIGISGFVLSSIRDELNKGWKGVKSAGEFITNSIIKSILDGIITITNTLISSLLVLLKQSTNMEISILPDFEFLIYGLTIKIENIANNIVLRIGNLVINFGNILIDRNLHFETLSLVDNYANMQLVSKLFLYGGLAAAKMDKFTYISKLLVLGSFVTLIVNEIVSILMVDNLSDVSSLAREFTNFHIFSALGILLGYGINKLFDKVDVKNLKGTAKSLYIILKPLVVGGLIALNSFISIDFTMEDQLISLETNRNNFLGFAFGLLEVYIINSLSKSFDGIVDHVIFAFEMALLLIHSILAIHYMHKISELE
jgi:hypothetical protein